MRYIVLVTEPDGTNHACGPMTERSAERLVEGLERTLQSSQTQVILLESVTSARKLVKDCS